MKKNIVIAILSILLLVVGIYCVSLRSQLAESKRDVEKYSQTINSPNSDDLNKFVNEKYVEAMTQSNLAKAKYDMEQAAKKAK